jgi:hypothetical protein
MAKFRFNWFFAFAVGACLPGCLRPFGGSRENQDFNPAPNQTAPKVVEENKSSSQIPVVPKEKYELVGPPMSISGMLLVPSLQEDNVHKPGKKLEISQTLIMAKPNLTGPDLDEARAAVLPVFAEKGNLLGQIGPASPMPPTSFEHSDAPPAPAFQTTFSDYSKKEPILEVFQAFWSGQPGRAVELMNGFDPAKQNIIRTLLSVLDGLTKKSPQDPLNPDQAAVFQAQLAELLEKTLKPRTALTISKMCFCKSIKAYGVYDPWPEDHGFRACSTADSLDGDMVQVYVELSNFCCERHNAFHEIHLSSSVEIRDFNKKLMWSKRFDNRKQPPVRSLAQLHDYFCRFYFGVPHLQPGKYDMTIQVVDETYPNRPPAVKSLPIWVIATSQTNS